MITIDQNCHSLWDVVPKLQALESRGIRVRHFIEDIDVAFTCLGATVDGEGLGLERERFYRSGGQDWGAALFYSEFLGRLPVDIRAWEPMLGQTLKALARELGRSVDELYGEFSPSDNWQLIGSSYVADRSHHRIIGDLSLEETAEPLQQVMKLARENTLATFPQASSRKRTNEWFDQEQQKLEGLLGSSQACTLVDVYRQWMRSYFRDGSVDLAYTSDLFSCQDGMHALLELFARDYDAMADLYNQAVQQTALGLHPLDKAKGELPFFATFLYRDHMVRSAAFLGDRAVHIGEKAFPLKDGSLPIEAMRTEGITSLAGKAILLVLQVRCGPRGGPLAVPYRGSIYMPAMRCLEKLLGRRGLLPRPVHPVVRVRFHLLDRMKSLEATIFLPPHLRGYFGRSEISSRELAENHAAIAAQARQRLEKFTDEACRRAWQDEAFADVAAEIRELERRKRQLATADPRNPEVRQLWTDIKLRRLEMLDGLLHQISCDCQAKDIDYWDSRGAILPWSIALGGQEFYNSLIQEAEVYEDPPPIDERE